MTPFPLTGCTLTLWLVKILVLTVLLAEQPVPMGELLGTCNNSVTDAK